MRPSHLLCASLVAALPVVLPGQPLKWTEVSRIETRVRVGGGGKPERSTTSISGGRIRTDDEESSMIIDFAGGQFTQLDHKDKSYWTMGFGDMMAATQGMLGQVREGANTARPEAERTKRSLDSAGVKMEFDVRVDQLGDGPKIAGYATKRAFVSLIAKVSSKTIDPATGEPAEGTFVFASDVYTASDFPAAKARLEAAKAARTGEEVDRQAREMAEGLKETMAMPGMEGMTEGMQRLASELEKLGSDPVRTLSYVITLGPGVTFDRQAIIDMADKPIPVVTLGGAMKEGMKQGAKDAIRGAAGLGGLLGRKKAEPQAQAQPQAAKQQVIQMRTTTEVEDVSRESIPDDAFKPPARYKEKKPEWMK